ncbi:hypothetical protein J6590_107864, partial [Homalodisca vitripennis]
AVACFRAKRRCDCIIDSPTKAIFSGPVALRVRPCNFLFNAELVSLKCRVHADRCVDIGEPPFLTNSLDHACTMHIRRNYYWHLTTPGS